MKGETKNLRCHSYVRTIVYANKIIHLKIEGCGAWDCAKCRKWKFEVWKTAINLVFTRKWLYAAVVSTKLNTLNRWMLRHNKKCIKVFCGENMMGDKEYLIISDKPFPNHKRKRKTTVFRLMWRYLLRKSVQAKTRKVTKNKIVTQELVSLLHYIEQGMLYKLKSDIPSRATIYKIRQLLNIPFHKKRHGKILAEGWDVQDKISGLDRMWQFMNKEAKAKVLKEKMDLLHPTNEGVKFIEENEEN